jgi:hypothetical protein
MRPIWCARHHETVVGLTISAENPNAGYVRTAFEETAWWVRHTYHVNRKSQSDLLLILMFKLCLESRLELSLKPVYASVSIGLL